MLYSRELGVVHAIEAHLVAHVLNGDPGHGLQLVVSHPDQ